MIGGVSRHDVYVGPEDWKNFSLNKVSDEEDTPQSFQEWCAANPLASADVSFGPMGSEGTPTLAQAVATREAEGLETDVMFVSWKSLEFPDY